MTVLGVPPQVWFPVITLIIGAILKGIFDLVADYRRAHREREARREHRDEAISFRRAEFQRTTLLELQENVAILMRFAAQAHHHDVMAYRQSGKWQRALLSPELNEGSRKAQATCS